MNTTTTVVATGVIVTIGNWAQDQTVAITTIVGGAGVAIALSLLPEQIAEPFGMVALLTALLIYGPDIAFKAGFLKTKPQGWGTQLHRQTK